ncbi:JmjC domain-containing protein 5 [Holothuria leucospilota]|uniref:JmjC domain-containing protein 5 n=1 Tax=Holothuria leucospilota TaxID=206669 RepID=A0A9Q1BE81_HOLLE|nr:JmjC domain-containing protein 5 [Holothuria leucospilota]
MELRNLIAYTLCLLLQPLTYNADQLIRGHKLELGKHRPPEGHIETFDVLPSAQEFWEKFASKRKPALFRSAAENFPAFTLWTDSYLLENFGNLKVKIEGKAEKDYYPEGDLGVAQDTLRHFLTTYKERNAYIVSQLPDPMATDILVMPFLNCGTFKERILEANLWFSSGGTKSLLHRDADNAINCLLNGTKDWVLIDPAYESLIPIAKEDVEAYGGFSMLNPDSVNLELYPQFKEVPWWYANMTPGDCLYLPYGYWHQVRSYGEKNLAASVLFSRLTEVNLEECRNQNPEFIALSDSQMVFEYDGYGDQTMGNTDPFELKESLLEMCEEYNILREDILKEKFAEGYNEFEDSDVQSLDIDLELLDEVTKRIISVLDEDNSGEVRCDVIEGLDLETLKRLADIMDNDPANTEGYEYAKYHPEQIRSLVDDILRDAEATEGGQVTSEMFVTGYQSIGGSVKRGKEIFTALNQEKKDAITKDDVMKYLPNVLEKFKSKMRAERTASQAWDQAIEEDLVSWNNPRENPEVNTKPQPISKHNEKLYRPIENQPDGLLKKDKQEQKYERLSDKTFQPSLVHDDL